MKKFKEAYKKEFLNTFEPENRLEEIKTKLEFRKTPLPQKPKKNLGVIFGTIGGVVLASLVLILVLFGLGDKNVPIYQKMEAFSSSALMQDEDNASIEMVANDDDSTIDYYIKADSNWQLAIYIDNPEQYEIMSFTISGVKYQNYEFAEGSTGEVIYINIANKFELMSGKYDLFIDELKYVDGDKIKNAKYDGDRTYTLGIAYENLPTLMEAESDITMNSYRLDFSLLDEDKLITGGTPYAAYLLQDKEILKTIDLTLDDSSFIFENLEFNTTYQVLVCATLDLYDGLGLRVQHLYEEEFTTLAGVTITRVESNYDSIIVEYNLDDSNMEIFGATLYQNGRLVKEIKGQVIEFTNLLSNTQYEIVLEYGISLDGNLITKTIVVEAQTKRYELPTLEGDILYQASRNKISLLLELVDPNLLIKSYYAEVYGDEELILTTTNLTQTLEVTKTYQVITVKVYVEYDLHDGLGVQTIVLTKLG